LKDFIFLNDGNPSRINNLVNFEKLRLLYTRVTDTLALAAVSYPFEKTKEIRDYIHNPNCESLEQLMARISVEGFDT